MSTRRAALAFVVAAGFADLATGVGLLTWPQLVLAALSLPAPAELIYLRFVGVFVAGVGLAYLYPFAYAEREYRLHAALEWTAGVRLAVALFLAVAVAAGKLGGAWLLVGTFDAVVALVQLGLLARGLLTDGH